MDTRSILLKCAAISRKLESDLAQIKESGRDKNWQYRYNEAAATKARQEFETYGSGLIASAAHDLYEAGKKLDSIRRPKSASDDSAARLFHLQRAKDGLNGQEPENAIAKYRETVGRLNDSEAKYRWIYEEALENSVKDSSYSHAVQVTIDAYTPQEQKDAKKALKVAEIMRQQVLTLANYIEHDIETLAAGESLANFDYAELYAEMVKKAEGQMAPAEQRAGAEILAAAAVEQ